MHLPNLNGSSQTIYNKLQFVISPRSIDTQILNNHISILIHVWCAAGAHANFLTFPNYMNQIIITGNRMLKCCVCCTNLLCHMSIEPQVSGFLKMATNCLASRLL